ncbi:MAG TPA: exopolysaccharide transport family protein [Candidatus Hydrogenedentes bacterium]|jgi:uncharacterized protein involved in exopolysaccharide biosynthesis/Mrp family chromosome partitioning ATPase|nr:hypothetical protein [Candidatus Hydrogenedentota bacterium]MDY0030429.1 exopolysaccharide transport family protein [FCB group bacterium]NLT61619.1 polysaccharide biosynthesis tyrosine autokinase [Candidatus Hydrogenedentota bacterium]HNZ19071.1 exopolysaccharide transport family protein [Candidatus Hydrogenedentota bacterium]HOH33668.1 exopolysaccharide transport family protein [Candidatus Hydrogenedentota bacterium]
MDQRQIFLRDVLTVLFKRKAFILVFIAVVFGVVLAGNYVWPPTYESVAKVRLIRGRTTSQPDPTVVHTEAGTLMMQLSREDVYSEIDLIYANDVLANVVDQLDLGSAMQRGTGPVQLAVRGIRELEYALRLKQRPDPRQRAIDALEEAIEVKADDKKYVLEIQCRLGDAQLAHDVLMALLEAYRQKHVDVFDQPGSAAFFEEQVARVNRELADAQQKLEAFRGEHQVVSLEAEKELLLSQYTEARKLLLQLTESQEAAQQAAAGKTDQVLVATLSGKTENTVVTELQLRLLELLLERNRITENLGPKHPQVVAILNEIDRAADRLSEAIEATRATTQAKIADLQQRIEELNKLDGELEDLQRAVDTTSDTLVYYTEKREEAIVADAMRDKQISSIRVVEHPAVAVNPVSPRKLVNLLIALVVGLVGGIALAFFLEYLDHGLKTPEDVDYYLKVPPLASFFRAGRHQPLDVGEAQRLSTMIDAVQAGAPNQLIEVTSAVSGEQAGPVAAALAKARAENPEWRVLYIDFAPHRAEGAPRKGLTDLVAGQADLEETLGQDGGLYVLSRGNAECPGYLWESRGMQAVLSDLRQRFDRIVLHTSPVRISGDAINAARYADGVVIVVRADETRREVVNRALDVLRSAKGRILGAVLTDRKQTIPGMVYRRI